jgi:hypothetical protein
MSGNTPNKKQFVSTLKTLGGAGLGYGIAKGVGRAIDNFAANIPFADIIAPVVILVGAVIMHFKLDGFAKDIMLGLGIGAFTSLVVNVNRRFLVGRAPSMITDLVDKNLGNVQDPYLLGFGNVGYAGASAGASVGDLGSEMLEPQYADL